MNKSTIKNFAIWARDELIANVSQKAFEYGVSKEEILEQNSESIHGKVLSSEEKEQRQVLIKKVNEKGFDQVIEEVAYTWFNRFIALRYMEVNNYLPNKIRVFTNERNEFDPEILKEALNLDIKGLNKEYIYDCIQNNKREELYKYLLITTCNDMGNYLPGMFTKISDYKVLLFPDNLLRDESVLAKLISEIDEDAWLDQVQIIGWLYQYYNTEPKANVYARPKGSKISKYDIPAVTQLFTPDWIVKYMVENSLGRLWLEGHENNALKENWRYYLEEAKQEESVQKQLDEIRLNRRNQKIEEVTVIDPCMGSGHILVYAFDVLMQIYESEGWTQRDAAISILENNLYGLDIDERAYQISYFALMMKARSYNRRVLSKGIKPHVYQIQASNNLPMQNLEFAIKDEVILKDIETLIHEMTDADEYGSLLTTSKLDYEAIYNYCETHRDGLFGLFVENQLLPFIRCAELLSRKYDITVTNPPYMSPTEKQLNYLQIYYPNSKADLFAAFMEVLQNKTKISGYQSIINQQSWMYLVSFENMRKSVLTNGYFINILHLGSNAFEEISGEVVQTCAYVYCCKNNNTYKSLIFDLKIGKNSHDKELMFLNKECRTYEITCQQILNKPQFVFDYMSASFNEKYSLGLIEENNGVYRGPSFKSNRVLRKWYEVDKRNIGNLPCEKENKWIFCSRNGSKYRWHTAIDEIVFMDEIKSASNASTQAAFGILWNDARFGNPTIIAKLKKGDFCYESALNLIECNEYDAYMYLALFNLGFYEDILKSRINGQHFSPIYIKKLNKFRSIDLIGKMVRNILDICEKSEDTIEISSKFKRIHIKEGLLNENFIEWEKHQKNNLSLILNLEENIKSILKKEIYSTPSNSMNKCPLDIQTRKDFVINIISYSVGCMFGRYSLDIDGLAYAGGEFDWSKYSKFIPDQDNIIPISDDEYFEDDIVARFIDFIQVVYGEDTLEENLDFIANALGGKGTSREVIRNYFLNEFYKDHCKMYQKRPIYWMFDSGKKNGFKCLIYLHRYQPDLVARIRTDYVHNTQSRLNYSIDALEGQLDHASTSERVRMNKEITRLKGQADEVRKYEEIVHHYADMMLSIDLDDGVKVNYEKFKDLLAKIK